MSRAAASVRTNISYGSPGDDVVKIATRQTVRRAPRRRLFDVKDVVPADQHAEDAVPVAARAGRKSAVADVLRAEPPEREESDALQAEEDQDAEDRRALPSTAAPRGDDGKLIVVSNIRAGR